MRYEITGPVGVDKVYTAVATAEEKDAMDCSSLNGFLRPKIEEYCSPDSFKDAGWECDEYNGVVKWKFIKVPQ